MTFVRDAVPHVRALKGASHDKPLWLWGGGDLFRHLAAAGLVDGVDVAIIPILLGGGLQLLPSPGPRLSLQLRAHRLYAMTGTLFVEYRRATRGSRGLNRSSVAHLYSSNFGPRPRNAAARPANPRGWSSATCRVIQRLRATRDRHSD